MKSIVVIDIAAEISEEDIKKLEEAGYLVVKVHGKPHEALATVGGWR